jgi:hypothetical protein
MTTLQYSKMTAQHKEYAYELIRNEGKILVSTGGGHSEKRMAKRRVIENFVKRFPHDRNLIEVLSQRKGATGPLNPLQIVSRLINDRKAQDKEEIAVAFTKDTDLEAVGSNDTKEDAGEVEVDTASGSSHKPRPHHTRRRPVNVCRSNNKIESFIKNVILISCE